MISWTLSLDGLLTSGAIMAVLGVIWRLSARFTTIEDQIRILSKDAEDVAKAITMLAVQQQRLDYIEKMVDETRRLLPFHSVASDRRP